MELQPFISETWQGLLRKQLSSDLHILVIPQTLRERWFLRTADTSSLNFCTGNEHDRTMKRCRAGDIQAHSGLLRGQDNGSEVVLFELPSRMVEGGLPTWDRHWEQHRGFPQRLEGRLPASGQALPLRCQVLLTAS